jgi:hypothetical protein
MTAVKTASSCGGTQRKRPLVFAVHATGLITSVDTTGSGRTTDWCGSQSQESWQDDEQRNQSESGDRAVLHD